MRFNSPFSFDEWKNNLGNRFSSAPFKTPAEAVREKHKIVDDLLSLGTLKLAEGSVPLYHMKLNDKATPRARVSITRAAYDTIWGDEGSGSGLFFITYANEPEKYRLSYVKYDRNLKSDPKRYTYLLGEGVPAHTPETRLKPQAFENLGAMEEAFSVEPVNSEFYKGIQGFFQALKTKLGGGSEDGDRAIRFIGRVLFCRFLAAKGLIPSALVEAIPTTKDAYKNMLSPLFFDTLNREYGKRKHLKEYEGEIPFLNGGLFAPREGEEGLGVPDSLIKDLFDFLAMYNFTVDESTATEIEVSIDPEMLGRVFENLLAEINPDTRESARKATGAFYTPREIVDYMVVESLKKYLHNRIKIDEDRLSALFSTIKDDDLSPKEMKSVKDALAELKILDPACGSGAFPMGLLQRLFDLRRRIGEKPQNNYQLKREILQKCIYGVDIQPIAVEISKLRAFLSIVLEEEKAEAEAKNLGIQPLPNLEFNFIIANSLVGLKADIDGTFRGAELKGLCDQIRKISELYFSADSPDKKLQAQQRFEAFRHNVETADDTYVTNEDRQKLLSFNPFTNSPALFFEPHVQFGIEPDKNFGIVIGNPPYLQMQSLPQSVKELYQNELYYSYTRVGDLYQLFYERSLNLLSAIGAAALITSNKWMRAGYGISSRNFLRNHAQIYGLVDLGGGRFKSATVDTNILFYGRRSKDTFQPTAPALTYGGALDSLPPLEDKKAFDRITIGENDEAWTVLNAAEAGILEKMSNFAQFVEPGLNPVVNGNIPISKGLKPLRDWDIIINRGVLTGFNEAFVIDGATRARLVAEDPKSAEIIKPLLKDDTISKYIIDFDDRYLINIHNGIKSLDIKPINIKNYPAIKKHIDLIIKLIERGDIKRRGGHTGTNKNFHERSDQGITSYNLRDCSYLQNFERPKIVWKQTAMLQTFAYDTNGYFLDVSGQMLIHKKDSEQTLKYILAILNCPIIDFYMKRSATAFGEKGTRWIPSFVESIPIPIPTTETKKQVAGLVDKILKAKKAGKPTDTLEKQVDEIAYKLYGLDDREIEIVGGGNDG